ncbi:MAG TPA: cobalt-precorrin-6A reductase [Pseudonocardiaceae bacterium]|jgi:precorrin-6A/cobalt-precorrin-6A reductase|nr:cobalt-precorrin-6A reductase [Pseudonocardiaceae bacterium]
MRRLLVLGGTGEARELAGQLAGQPGLHVVSALAGRTEAPRLPEGEVRIGGFGGAEGLAGFLRADRIDVVLDATHPFAARITASALAAARELDLPIAVLRRPGWPAGPGDHWHRVGSLSAAAEALPSLGERVFLSVGRQGIGAFAGLAGHWFLARCVHPPHPPVPERLDLLLDRGPYTVDGELELLRRNEVQVLVSRDSGGGQTSAKLVAARELGLPVVLIDRPDPPEDVPILPTIDAVLDWLTSTLSRGPAR